MTNPPPAARRTPDPSYRPRRSLAATATMAALVVGPLLALSYPVATAVAVTVVLGVAASVWALPVVLERVPGSEPPAKVCVPGTDLCVEGR